MRVLIVHNDYGRPSGEEHALGTIEKLLEENGHEVLQFRKSSKKLMNGGILKQMGAFFSGIHSFRSAREVARFLDENPVDVVQLQNVFPFISPSVLPVFRKRNIPVVMRCPNYRLFCPTGLHLRNGQVCEKCVGGKEWNCAIYNCERSRIKSLGYALRSGFARWRGSFTKNVDRFLVLSEFQKQKFLERGIEAEKLEILPNFSSNEITASDDASTKELGTKISFVGRLADEKGIELFFQAAEALPELPFAAAGDFSWVEQTGRAVPPNLELRGFLSGDELSDFYRQSRMLCFPSQWYEGFPNVIITAMEHEKPIVASRIGAIPEIVEHNQSGLLHETGSVDELIAAIQDLYADEAKCQAFGTHGRRQVQSRFHAKVVYQKLLSVYESVTH